MPVVDMTGITTEYTPIDAGVYEARFIEFENRFSQKGNPMVRMAYEITEEGDFEGRKVYGTRTLTKESLWSLKRDLIALDADPDDIAAEFDTDELLPNLIGAECKVVVSLGEPDEQGRRFNSVDKVKAPYEP